jgi:hypothetical protein
MFEDRLHVEQMIVGQAEAASVIVRNMIGIHHPFDRIESIDFSSLVLGNVFHLAFILDKGHVVNNQIFLVNEIHGATSQKM